MPGDRLYVIDTSSVCEIRRAIPVGPRLLVWRALGRLVDKGRLLFPRHVVDELAPYATPVDDEVFDWVNANAKVAADHERLEGDVMALLLENPDVAAVIDDEKEGVDEADPYVLALALRLQREGKRAAVVTQEHRDRPRKLSLGSACGMLDVTSLPLLPFLSIEGIWKPSV